MALFISDKKLVTGRVFKYLKLLILEELYMRSCRGRMVARWLHMQEVSGSNLWDLRGYSFCYLMLQNLTKFVEISCSISNLTYPLNTIWLTSFMNFPTLVSNLSICSFVFIYEDRVRRKLFLLFSKSYNFVDNSRIFFSLSNWL